MKYQEIVDILKVGVHSISFYKLNGDLRDMEAVTRDPSLIPEGSYSSGNDNLGAQPGDVVPRHVSVWDIKNQNWRSFVIENLIMIGLRENVTQD